MTLDNMIKKAGDSKWTDSANNWGNGGKVGAGIENWAKIAFDDAIFAGGASIYKSGAWGDKIIRNQPRNTRGTDYYIKVLKLCQVATAVEQSNIVMRVGKNAVEWSAD